MNSLQCKDSAGCPTPADKETSKERNRRTGIGSSYGSRREARTDPSGQTIRSINCLKRVQGCCTRSEIRNQEWVSELSGAQEVNEDDEEEGQLPVPEACVWTESGT
jgi:hypothetical protein